MMALPKDGLIYLRSSLSLPDTVDALEGIVLARGLGVTVRIDHASAAAKAGLKMPPAELLIFGNPTAGTPLIVHGEQGQLVPIADTAMLTAKIVRNSTLKIYPGAPHGLTVTFADKLNQDLLPFLKSQFAGRYRVSRLKC